MLVASYCHDPANVITGSAMEIESPPARRGGINGNVVPPAPRGNRRHETHGLTTLRDAATRLGSRAIDGRSSLSYALKKWRRELVNDLGGEDNISTQQSALIDLAVRASCYSIASTPGYSHNRP
jgi:hypothetical protein